MLRVASGITKRALDFAATLIAPGITTDHIDKEIHKFIVCRGAYPSPLGYLGFPKSVCTSVNNVLCHGIPDIRPLRDGDIVNVDVTSFMHGFHGDSSRTFLVGNVDPAGQDLVSAASQCLDAAIKLCAPGVPYSAIGNTIGALSKSKNFSISKEFIGHGIGRNFHCPPQIFHHPNNFPGVMEPWTAFTIEPILNEFGSGMHILSDGWTAVTDDKGRSAQFEHTILITETVRVF